jgi:hypothetical protein
MVNFACVIRPFTRAQCPCKMYIILVPGTWMIQQLTARESGHFHKWSPLSLIEHSEDVIPIEDDFKCWCISKWVMSEYPYTRSPVAIFTKPNLLSGRQCMQSNNRFVWSQSCKFCKYGPWCINMSIGSLTSQAICSNIDPIYENFIHRISDEVEILPKTTKNFVLMV